MTLVAELEPEVTIAGRGPGAETEFFGEPTPLAIPLAWEFDEDDTHVVADARTWGETWYRAAACAVVGMLGVLAVVMFSADDRNPDAGLVAPPSVSVLPSAPVPTAPVAAPTMAPTTAPPATLTLPPEDASFLAMLAHDGMPAPVSVPNVIAAAADVCRMVSHGSDYDYVESWMRPPHGVFTQRQSEIFLADALAAYCPHAALPTATPQAADSAGIDSAYLSEITQRGLVITDTSRVIKSGHAVCAYLAQGHTQLEATKLPRDPAMEAAAMDVLVAAAVTVYCPQYGG